MRTEAIGEMQTEMDGANQRFGQAYFESYSGKSKYRDPVLKRTFRKRLIKRFARQGDLLELGCAYGYLLKVLEDDFRCEGVDISAHAIEVAKTVTKAKVEQADVVEALSKRASASYDTILAFDILEHLERDAIEIAVSEIARLLRPNGTLIVSVPNWSSIGRDVKGKVWHGFRDETHVSLLKAQEWKAEFGKHLRVRAVSGDAMWDAPYLPVLPRALQRVAFALTGVVAIATAGRFPTRLSENLLLTCTK